MVRLQRLPKRGFNLIEAAIVLGVVGLVIGGIWVAASAVNENMKVTNTVADIVHMCSAAKNTFSRKLAPSGSSSFDVTSSAISAGVAPSRWLNGAVLTPQIGGYARLYWWQADKGIWHDVDIGGGTTIILADVPNKYCRRILTGLTKSSSITPFIEIGVGSPTASFWTWSSGPTLITTPYYGNVGDYCGSDPLNMVNITCYP